MLIILLLFTMLSTFSRYWDDTTQSSLLASCLLYINVYHSAGFLLHMSTRIVHFINIDIAFYTMVISSLI